MGSAGWALRVARGCAFVIISCYDINYPARCSATSRGGAGSRMAPGRRLSGASPGWSARLEESEANFARRFMRAAADRSYALQRKRGHGGHQQGTRYLRRAIARGRAARGTGQGGGQAGPRPRGCHLHGLRFGSSARRRQLCPAGSPEGANPAAKPHSGPSAATDRHVRLLLDREAGSQLPSRSLVCFRMRPDDAAPARAGLAIAAALPRAASIAIAWATPSVARRPRSMAVWSLVTRVRFGRWSRG